MLWVVIALDVGFLALCGWAWPRLPELIASHFDGAGVPNGYSSKAAFTGLSLAILALVNLIYVGLPPWLAGANADLRARLLWFGMVALAFMLAISALVVSVNLAAEPRLPGEIVWPLLGAYGVFVIGWVAAAVRAGALTRRREG
jgi:hypothetical protein